MRNGKLNGIGDRRREREKEIAQANERNKGATEKCIENTQTIHTFIQMVYTIHSRIHGQCDDYVRYATMN